MANYPLKELRIIYTNAVEQIYSKKNPTPRELVAIDVVRDFIFNLTDVSQKEDEVDKNNNRSFGCAHRTPAKKNK